MKSLNKQFKLDMKRFIEKANLSVEEVVRGTALSIDAALVLKTPKDNGHLQSNWNFKLNKVDQSADPDKTTRTGNPTSELASFKVGDTVFMTNSLPYMRVIEFGEYGKPPGSANGPKTKNGYSTQAPQGVIELTAIEFRKYVKKAVAEVKK